jgi:cobalt-zinc-cadmium resistance protein CzcA
MWTVEYEPRDETRPPRTGEPGWQPDGSYLTPGGERLATEVERATYLRTVQDWIIRPQLAGIEGLAGVDTIGGYVKQIVVEPDPGALVAHGVSLADLVTALERNNLATGAGFIERNGESYIVRASGRLTRPDEVGEVAILEVEGTPIRVRDVAAVRLGHALRTGAASENGEEVVTGTAMMLVGANSRTVAAAVDRRMAAINRTLPPGVRAKTVLNRMDLVDAVIRTVRDNLVEGALLVVAVLFALLGNLRAALITALAIPLSMLLTAIGMVQTRTSGNLMSLGAIDFGLIVDGSVIVVENCVRRLAERQGELGRVLTRQERLETVFAASRQVRRATVFGEAIIITVYIPILALTGVEGKMFHPMAWTVIMALSAAFVLSLTFIPAMVALCVTGRVRERESFVLRLAGRAYEIALGRVLRRPWIVVAAGAVLFLASLGLFGRLGQSFVPALSELDFVVHAIRVPSASLSQSVEMQRELERAIQRVPEVAFVFSRVGTADLATDPMPPNFADTFVVLRPRPEWSDPGDTKEDVRRRIETVIEEVPGNAYEFTQPIEMRFNELLAGVRADLAVRIFGDEYKVLAPVAERIAAELRAVRGAADTRVEQMTGTPVLDLRIDRDSLWRYGLTVADAQDVVATAVAGRTAGQIFEGDRRFDVVVRLAPDLRRDPTALASLPLPLTHRDSARVPLSIRDDDVAARRFLPLSAVASFDLTEEPNQINRDNGKRRLVVQTNVRGRDLGSYVDEARDRIARGVVLPPGTWIEWGGQFENLERAERRLLVVVPLCFVVILTLLYSTFGSVRHAAMVFSGVPLALSGGIVSLWLRDMPFSITAAVGFIALSGVAVLNGLVMVTFINELRERGAALGEAILRGALGRLRPVLMTALVASLGFAPMALATGTGAEVQRPLATVVIGGLVSSTALTLFVLPALYLILSRRRAS